MRKWRFPEILLGALLTVCIFSIGWSASFSSHQPTPVCEHGGANNKSDQCGEDVVLSPVDGLLDWLGKTDNLGLLVTFALAWGAVALVLDGRKHSERELRAYISVEDYGLKNMDGPGHPIGWVQFKNTGQTTAKNVRFYIGFAEDEPTTLPRVDPKEPASVRDLGAGGDYVPEQPWIHYMGVYRAELIKGERTGWFHGVIQYLDVFGEERFTWFKFGIVRDTEKQAPTADKMVLSVYITPDGNKST